MIDTVVVIEPQVTVVEVDGLAPSITVESPVTTVEAGSPEITIVEVTMADQISIIEVGVQGPTGLPGPRGAPGIGSVPGDETGDILRWNATDDAWEVKSEPFEFKQIVLTPQLAALVDVEGGLLYKSTDKSVYVCTADA